MTKAYLYRVMFFLFSISAFLTHVSYAADTRWYLTPGVSYIMEDKDRNADNNIGYQLGIGKPLSDSTNLELTAVMDTLSQGWSLNEFKQEGLQLDILHFFSRGTISPYGVLGAGVLSTKFAGSKKSAEMVNVGLGAATKLWKGRVGLRSDVRYRIDEQGFNVKPSFDDVVFNVGLVIPLGAEKKAPMAKPVVVPAPEPPKAVILPVPEPPKPVVVVPVPESPKDADADGVIDAADACPETPAGIVVNQTGCELDSDSDGVVNSKDLCPDSPKGSLVDATGCTVVINKDSDGDGIVDAADTCPGTPAGATVNAKGCELDDDGDGIVNRLDQCPDSKTGERIDSKGCKIPEVIVLKGVNFESGSDTLLSDSKPILDDAAETLKRNPGIVVEVAGYTDNVGKAVANKALSQKRAEAVSAYLVGKGVPAGSLKAKGYGMENAISDNNTAEGKAKNRRVELHIMNQ